LFRLFHAKLSAGPGQRYGAARAHADLLVVDGDPLKDNSLLAAN
jgi:hypothetical protein